MNILDTVIVATLIVIAMLGFIRGMGANLN